MTQRLQLIQLNYDNYSTSTSASEYSIYSQEREIVYITKNQSDIINNSIGTVSEYSFLKQLQLKNKLNSADQMINTVRLTFHSKAKHSFMTEKNNGDCFSKNYCFDRK